MLDGSFVLDAIGSFVGLLFSGVTAAGSAVVSAVGFVGNVVTTVFSFLFG